MKSRKTFALVMLLIVSILLSSTPITANTERPIDVYRPSQKLTIQSQTVSAGAWEYAETYFDLFLQAAVLGNSLVIGNETSLGMPFAIPSTCIVTYYFPIISDGIIVGTFRVFVDDGQSYENNNVTYTGVLSAHLAEELNALSSSRLSSNVLSLHYDNGNLMVEANGVVELFSSNPSSELPKFNMPENNRAYLHTVTPYESVIYPSLQAREMIVPFSGQRLLSVVITEQQVSRPWCFAYTTAMVLRFMTPGPGNINALTLMRAAHPGVSDATLLDFRFYRHHAINAYTSRGFRNAAVQRRTLAVHEVVNSINRDVPLQMIGERTDNKTQHTFVIRGYMMNGVIFSYWNPWESFFETMSGTATIINARGITYRWFETVTA